MFVPRTLNPKAVRKGWDVGMWVLEKGPKKTPEVVEPASAKRWR